MKKLLILAAVAIVTPGAIGCQCGPLRNWLCDGYEARCRQQCSPCYSSCDPCAGGGVINPAPTYGEIVPPGMVPGPIVQQ